MPPLAAGEVVGRQVAVDIPGPRPGPHPGGKSQARHAGEVISMTHRRLAAGEVPDPQCARPQSTWSASQPAGTEDDAPGARASRAVARPRRRRRSGGRCIDPCRRRWRRGRTSSFTSTETRSAVHRPNVLVMWMSGKARAAIASLRSFEKRSGGWPSWRPSSAAWAKRGQGVEPPARPPGIARGARCGEIRLPELLTLLAVGSSRLAPTASSPPWWQPRRSSARGPGRRSTFSRGSRRSVRRPGRPAAARPPRRSGRRSAGYGGTI